MAEGYEVEHIHCVYDNIADACVDVGPDSHGIGIVEIRTTGKSAEHFGSVRLAITPEMALVLASAIEACAKELMR